MKGIYVLLISIAKSTSVSIGALGDKVFQEGLYVYVGSAQNNLEKRVKRHIKKTKPKFWHIDYLLSSRHARVIEVFYKEAGKFEECRVAKRLFEVATALSGFGSSDCACKSHLFRIETRDNLNEFTSKIGLKPLNRMILMAKIGWCVWITGLPGSGKSTVSRALLKLLERKGLHAQLLSSDALRKVMTPRPTYSLEERDSVYSTLAYIAELLTQNGVNVVIDATGNLRRYRDHARKRISSFVEVYLECPLETCVQREGARTGTHNAPRRIYEQARKGKAPTVPGLGQPYEPPSDPEITLETTKYPPLESARKVLEKILQS